MTTQVLSVPTWNPEFTEQALAEGWMVFNDDEIQRDDEASVFVDDDAALGHVYRRASEGSALHQAALAIHRAGELARGEINS